MFSEQHQGTFTWKDYIIFLITLLVSTFIGLYFGCTGGKQDSANEYMFGKRRMKAAPIALSVLTCQFSGVSVMGVPTDVYLYGIGSVLFAVGSILALLCSYLLVYPVLVESNVTTPYEYLNLRFNKSIYLMSSCLSILIRLLTLPIVVYAPALALSHCTGFNVHHVTPIMCIVCVFYTTIGGLKAVVWTDSFQFIFMLASSLIVCYVGTTRSGGLGEVLRTSLKGQRLDLDFDVNPTTHHTFWGTIFGMFFFFLYYYGLDQCCVQKFLSLADMKQSKRAHILLAVGVVIFYCLIGYSGLLLYTLYGNCDPVTLKKVSVADQILPYFVLEVGNAVPGLAGLFIAGVFNASLRFGNQCGTTKITDVAVPGRLGTVAYFPLMHSLSAYLNSTTCLIYNDFLRKLLKVQPAKAGKILKLLVLLMGLLIVGLVYVVEQIDTIVQLTYTILGATGGTEAGVFVFGMLVPFGNSNGALSGGIVSFVVMFWMMIGSYYYKVNKYIRPKLKPLSVSGCTNETFVFSDKPMTISWQPPFVYRISTFYYPLIGMAIVFLVGLPISWFTRKSSNKPDKRLLSPIVRWMMGKDEPLAKESVPLRE